MFLIDGNCLKMFHQEDGRFLQQLPPKEAYFRSFSVSNEEIFFLTGESFLYIHSLIFHFFKTIAIHLLEAALGTWFFTKI